MSSTFAVPGTTRTPSIGRQRDRRRDLSVLMTADSGLGVLRDIPGWQLVDRSAFGFVDLVAVAPSAVLAVTVRHHLPLTGDEHVQRAWKAIRDAKGSAALMRQMLGPDAPEIAAVLVLTGPGAPDLPDGHMLIKGVRVVDGRRPERWVHLFATPRLDELEQRRLARSLRL